MTRRAVLTTFAVSLVWACLFAEPAHAQDSAPNVMPATASGEVIRSWGNDAMAGVMGAWHRAYRKSHPEVRFEQALFGSGTGMAGIITGTSELALMGRPVTTNEVIGFEWVFRYKPLQIQVLHGSLDQDGKSPALAVFVSDRNPLRSISLQQLAAIAGCPGSSMGTQTWAAAGATAAWAAHPIHVLLPDEETGTGTFLQQTLLGTGDRWNWSVVREFQDKPQHPAGEQIMTALKSDPDALAVSTLRYATPGTHPLQIDGVLPTLETLRADSYPLTRGVYIDINRKPGAPVEPRVKAFLDFVLSPEGQRIAAADGSFVALSPALAAEQRKKLE